LENNFKVENVEIVTLKESIYNNIKHNKITYFTHYIKEFVNVLLCQIVQKSEKKTHILRH